MVARASFVTYALDGEGRPISGCTVDVYNPDTTTHISETIYEADDPDTTTLANPFIADADGRVEFFLAVPKRVDLKITKTGFDPVTIQAIAHQLTAATLVMKEAGTPLAQRGSVNFLAGFDLTDDAANDETEVALDLLEVTAFTDHSARHESGGADIISIAGLAGTPTELTNHLNDATDAHDASAISILDTAADFTATDVEGALAELQSDNEAHVAAGDPHTGYRLESADHTHQSTGAQAGTLDHGLALTGLSDDDHPQYLKEEASGGTAAEVPDHTHASGAQAGTVAHSALTGVSSDQHHAQEHTAADHTWSGVNLEKSAIETVADNAAETLSWDTEVFDTDGYHAGANPTRITIPTTGKYRLEAGIRWNTDSDGVRRVTIMRAGTIEGEDRVAASPNGNTVHHCHTPVLACTAGDIFEVEVFHQAGGNLDVLVSSPGTYFQAERVE